MNARRFDLGQTSPPELGSRRALGQFCQSIVVWEGVRGSVRLDTDRRRMDYTKRKGRIWAPQASCRESTGKLHAQGT